jgi:hypothetical protein
VSLWLNKNKPLSHEGTKVLLSRRAGKPCCAARGSPSTFVDSFPYSLTVCPASLKSQSYTVHGLPSTVHFAVCRPWSAVYPAVRGLRSAVHIRLFVPLFVDGLPRQPQKPALPPSTVHFAVCRPWSAVYPAVRGLRSAVHIRLFVPYSLTVCPASLKSLPYHRPPPISPSAVRGLRSILPSAVCGPPSTFVYSFPIR